MSMSVRTESEVIAFSRGWQWQPTQSEDYAQSLEAQWEVAGRSMYPVRKIRIQNQKYERLENPPENAPL
jgi:hypothetical protein